MSPPQFEATAGSARELKHVAIFLADLQGGGAERMMVNLAGGLARKEIRVDLLLANTDGPYLAEVQKSVRLVELNAGRVLRALPLLTSYLRRERPQLLLTTLHHASVVALLARRLSNTHIPVFIREANTPSQQEPSLRRPKSWLITKMIRRLYRQADGVIAVSKGVAEDLERYFGHPIHQTAVLYNPVVTDELGRLACLEPEHSWFEPDAPPVILAVGRLHVQKDFATLIHAFARLQKERDSRLMILGEGNERSELEGLVRQLGLEGRVALPGFVENPFAFMSRAGVFVLSSRWEGLPGALIQAMACGCPVVATDCRSGPAEVLDNGRYGELVQVGDIAGMAEAIVRTLDSARQPAQVQARSQRYSQAEIVDDYVEYFEGKLAL
ncbi:MAG: glycosyltransferase [Trueperaceae bacterium]